MNYEQVVTHGTGERGRQIWRRIAKGDVNHNDLLKEMRWTQEALATYAKHNKMDEVQKQMVGEIKLLETFAWRTFMFGKPQQFSIRPGMDGEFAKRLRNDSKYHNKRDFDIIRSGESGCMLEQNMFSRIQRPCLKFRCKHVAIHHAHKWIKREIRKSWEADYLNKYSY